MAKVATNITIDEDVKKKSQKMLADFGLDLSTAVNMFLRQMLREKAIPFKIGEEVPNKATISAIKEVDKIEKNRNKYKSYKNVDELMGGWKWLI